MQPQLRGALVCCYVVLISCQSQHQSLKLSNSCSQHSVLFLYVVAVEVTASAITHTTLAGTAEATTVADQAACGVSICYSGGTIAGDGCTLVSLIVRPNLTKRLHSVNPAC